MAKIVTKEALIGEQGANLIAQIVLKMGWLWRCTPVFDTGVDGEIEIRDQETGRATGYIIKVQSKAGQSYFRAETDQSFEFLASEWDLQYWLQGNFPLVLVVSKPDKGEAYWVSVKEYFEQRPQDRASRKICFDKPSTKFDETVALRLKESKVLREKGLYISPHNINETIYSNLVPVTSYPPTVYFGATKLTSHKSAWKRLTRAGEKVGDEWFLKNKKIYSFIDIESSPLKRLLSKGERGIIPSNEWAFSNEEEKRRDFVRLLNKCLIAKCGTIQFRYSKMLGCIYFWPEKTQIHPRLPIKVPYKSFQKLSHCTIFQGYGPEAKFSIIYYYRHLAFEWEFREFDGTWYLVITPTYVYKNKYLKYSRNREEYLKRIKRIENNSNVVRYVRCIAELLSKVRENDLFPDYELIRFGTPPQFSVNVGLIDDQWLKNDPHHQGEATEDSEDEQREFVLFSL